MVLMVIRCWCNQVDEICDVRFAVVIGFEANISGNFRCMSCLDFSKGEGYRGARPTPPLLFAGKTAKTAAASPQGGRVQPAVSHATDGGLRLRRTRPTR
jgi:hypothetical protein